MRWYRGHLARGAHFSGIDQGERGGRGRHGGNRQPGQRSGSRLLGMGFGLDHAAIHIPGHVHSPSSAILVSSKYHHGLVNDDHHVRGANVLWWWLWHHAGVYRGLLWSEERRPHLWVNVDRLELCQR